MTAVRGAKTSMVIVALACAGAWAQQDARGGGGPRRGMQGLQEWGASMEGAMSAAVAAVATNDAVAKAIGLTPEQRNAFKDKLSAEKMRSALSAARLAQAITAILTDPQIVADLGLTQAQVNAVKTAMTSELIRQAIPPQEVERLARALTAGPIAAAQAIQERVRQFDKDGDGRLSDEERQAAMNAWQERRGERGSRANRPDRGP